MSEIKAATAAALRALMRDGRDKDQLAAQAGLNSPRMLDYTLDSKHAKGLGIKSIKRLAQNLGMSLETFLLFANKCLEEESLIATGDAKLPAVDVSGNGHSSSYLRADVKSPLSKYGNQPLESHYVELKNELEACRRECQELRDDNRTLREENRELRNELKRFSRT
jgi:hypothetical protein